MFIPSAHAALMRPPPKIFLVAPLWSFIVLISGLMMAAEVAQGASNEIAVLESDRNPGNPGSPI